MARTKASVGAKVSSHKSTKSRALSSAPAATNTGTSGGGDKTGKSSSGGNTVCPRETPKWQKPITNFFIQGQDDHKQKPAEEDYCVGASTSKKQKHNVIESDDDEPESSEQMEGPRNSVLDESYELQPLVGDKNHKIKEYYNKNKGAHETENKRDENNKENLHKENGKRKSVKRELDDVPEIKGTKKVKVN